MRVEKVEPLTDAELDLLIWVTVSNYGIAIVGFSICLVASIYVAIKTRTPGRYLILSSALLLIVFLVYEQIMGGNLEWVFGPVGNLYKVIAYSIILVVFSIGYFKSARYFSKNKNH